MTRTPQNSSGQTVTDANKANKTVRQKAEQEELEELRPGNPESFTHEELERFEDDAMREQDA